MLIAFQHVLIDFLNCLKSRNGRKYNHEIHQSSFWRVSPQFHCRIGWNDKLLAATHRIEVAQSHRYAANNLRNIIKQTLPMPGSLVLNNYRDRVKTGIVVVDCISV
jgi:hypothetical protein